VGQRRGRLTMKAERKDIISHINEACQSGARQAKACEVIGISIKTLQRWHNQDNLQDGRLDAHSSPANKLTELLS